MSLARPPLQDSCSEIRLLRIEPFDNPSDQIKCSLEVHDRSEVQRKYVAISYTWGPPNPTVPILVNGVELDIRQNCWLALWQMRLHYVSHLYWIDSICIDQDCHGEKQLQVSQMGDIYSAAGMVAVCIGDHDPNIETRWVYTRAGIHNLLDHFFRREYFTRLWTVQECCLARYIRVFCGVAWIDWHHLAYGLTSREKVAIRPPEEGWVQIMRNCKSRFDSHVSFDIAKLILQYGDRQCYDQRDKIYGLLPLASESIRKRVAIDYTKSLWHVLLDYAGLYNVLALPSAGQTGSSKRDSECDGNPLAVDATEMWTSVQLLALNFAKASPDFDSDVADALLRNEEAEHSCTLGSDAAIQPATVAIEVLVDGSHTIDVEAGDFLDTTGLFYMENWQVVPKSGARRFELCTCCLPLSELKPEASSDSPLETIHRPTTMSLAAQHCICLVRGSPQQWQGVHAFAVPPETRSGDLILFCQATEPIISDRKKRLVLVCRPCKDQPSRLEIIGQATHLTSGWPCPQGFRSKAIWNDSLCCHFPLTTTDLLLACLFMEPGMNILMSVVANSIKLFPELVMGRAGGSVFEDNRDVVDQASHNHRTTFLPETSRSQTPVRDKRNASRNRKDSLPDVSPLDTHELARFLSGKRIVKSNGLYQRLPSPMPEALSFSSQMHGYVSHGRLGDELIVETEHDSELDRHVPHVMPFSTEEG